MGSIYSTPQNELPEYVIEEILKQSKQYYHTTKHDNKNTNMIINTNTDKYEIKFINKL